MRSFCGRSRSCALGLSLFVVASFPVAASAAPTEAPKLVKAPVITGPLNEGSTISVSNGSWTGHPRTWTYAWKHCGADGELCIAIAGATAKTYELTATDVGKRLRAAVTATNAIGSTTEQT